MTFAFTLTSVLFFGVLLLVGGLFQLAQAFTCRGWKAVLWHVLIGLLYVAAGIDIIYNPVRASAILTLHPGRYPDRSRRVSHHHGHSDPGRRWTGGTGRCCRASCPSCWAA